MKFSTSLGQWARRMAMGAAAFCLGQASMASAQSVILPEGMTIPLQTQEDISSKSAKKGDPVKLAVAKAVTIGGATAIPAGTPVMGEVSKVRDNGLLGRSGKLDISVTTLKVGQQFIPLRGERNAKGKSGTLGSVGAGIVFLPLAVIVRGRDVKVPAGTMFEAYVDQEVTLPVEGMAAEGAATGMAAPVDAPPPGAIRSVDPNAELPR